MTETGLTGTGLKWIALASMLLDHIGAILLDDNFLLRTAGRIAFPIFCFLLVEGFLYTSSRLRYGLRLLLFAFISEIPFDLAFQHNILDFSSQNVFFTLSVGYIVLCLLERFSHWEGRYLLPVLGGILCYLLQTDYSYWGVLLIFIFYFYHNNPRMRNIMGCISLLWEAMACLAFIPISMYNGKRGAGMKYLFYAFYPMHLLLLAAIRYFIIL